MEPFAEVNLNTEVMTMFWTLPASTARSVRVI